MAEKGFVGTLKKYLGSEDNPVSMAEFKEFWQSCTDEEKEQFKSQLPEELL